MNRGEAIFPALLLLAVAALVAGGIVVAGYSWKVIAFPLGAALVIGGLCVVAVASALTGRTARAAADGSALSLELPAEPVTAASLAWLFALAPFLYGLGFVFGPAAYLLLYLRVHGSSWMMSVALAAGSVLVTWGLFIKMLRVLLPLQPLWLG